MTDATRDEHLEWCKQRARQYVDDGALSDAVASMASDLRKHPDTDGPHIPVLVLIGAMDAQRGDANAVRRWVDGFN